MSVLWLVVVGLVIPAIVLGSSLERTGKRRRAEADQFRLEHTWQQ